MSAESLRELDELKQGWRVLEQRSEREHALNVARFKHERMASVRGALRPLAIGQAFQALCGGVLIVGSVMFWTSHREPLHLFAVGVFGHAYGAALVALAVRDWIAIAQIDYAGPVLAIQKQLAALRARRIRWALFHGVVGCFSWIPLVTALVALAGLDLWSERPDVVGWFVASGLVSLGCVLAFHAWSRRPRRAALAEKLDDGAAGRSLRRARSMLDEIARFERD